MTVVEFLHQLIEEGQWSSISPENQRIFLAILARSRGGSEEINWKGFNEFTGVDEKERTHAIEELVENGLLQKSKNEVKLLVESLDHESISIPKPPYKKTAPEFVEALRNLMAGQWTGILGGALVVYLIQVWFDYIYRMDNDNSDLAHDQFCENGIFEGFQELESVAYKELSKPLHLMTPTEWSAIIEETEEPQKPETVTSSDVEALFARLSD